MGICSTLPKYRLVRAKSLFSSEKIYKSRVVCKVKQRNPQSKITGFLEFPILLDPPLKISSQKAYLSDSFFWVSSCILPSLNPRQLNSTPCQDACKILIHEDLLFISLFDSFGSAGEKVSAQCIEICEDFFYDHIKHYHTTPNNFLRALTKHLDEYLSAAKDIETSGCSELLVLISDKSINICNLGDTRCVIATTDHKKTYGKHSLMPLQLTQEHRPEYVKEFDRITAAGGRVQKLIGLNGNLKGRYRVWESVRNTPGLTISRALGNPAGKALGISAEPELCQEKIDAAHYFLIAASDGVWDVMDNQEVTNFIEAYRDSCLKGIDVSPEEDFVSFSNACISQLICEEARARWLLKIEDEDVIMDDITCVIVEFSGGNESVDVIHDAGAANAYLEEVKERETRKAPTLKDSYMRESRRVSLVGVSVLNSKTEML